MKQTTTAKKRVSAIEYWYLCFFMYQNLNTPTFVRFKVKGISKGQTLIIIGELNQSLLKCWKKL